MLSKQRWQDNSQPGGGKRGQLGRAQHREDSQVPEEAWSLAGPCRGLGDLAGHIMNFTVYPEHNRLENAEGI